MPVSVDTNLCQGCGVCAANCLKNAIHLYNGKAFIDQTLCIECLECIEVCPTGALRSHQSENSTLQIAKEEQPELSSSISIQERQTDQLSAGGVIALMLGQVILPRIANWMDFFSQRWLTVPIRNYSRNSENIPGMNSIGRHRKQRARRSRGSFRRRW